MSAVLDVVTEAEEFIHAALNLLTRDGVDVFLTRNGLLDRFHGQVFG